MTKELHLLCGIPGSGKTTWCKAEVERVNQSEPNSAIRISRDDIRYRLNKEYIDTDYFRKEDEVFETFLSEINKSIEEGIKYIYIDATHVSTFSQRKVLWEIKPQRAEVLIYDVFRVPLEVAIKRNNQRTGWQKAPEAIIKSMYRSFKECKIIARPPKILVREVGSII